VKKTKPEAYTHLICKMPSTVHYPNWGQVSSRAEKVIQTLQDTGRVYDGPHSVTSTA